MRKFGNMFRTIYFLCLLLGNGTLSNSFELISAKTNHEWYF